MKNLIGLFVKHSFLSVMLAAISSVAIATGITGAAKVVASNSEKIKVPEVQTVQAAQKEDANLNAQTPSPTVKPVSAATSSKRDDSRILPKVIPTTPPVNSGIKSSVGLNESGPVNHLPLITGTVGANTSIQGINVDDDIETVSDDSITTNTSVNHDKTSVDSGSSSNNSTQTGGSQTHESDQ
ncbi:hypothetical protein M1328_05625 [Patescibacteria group bacterium]|nr:hypothetical protein [Patescibacteria group bacterium]